MSHDCTFSEHIHQTASSARQMTGWIFRTFLTRNPEHLLPIFKTLVISRMEYSCQLWSPNKIKDIQELEQVQRVFTRRVTRDSLNYWERLRELKLYSLQRRRERYIIMYMWMILEGTVPNPSTKRGEEITSHHHPRLGRICTRKTVNSVSQRLLTIQADSFAYTGPRLFNCLPKSLRDMFGCSTETF